MNINNKKNITINYHFSGLCGEDITAALDASFKEQYMKDNCQIIFESMILTVRVQDEIKKIFMQLHNLINGIDDINVFVTAIFEQVEEIGAKHTKRQQLRVSTVVEIIKDDKAYEFSDGVSANTWTKTNINVIELLRSSFGQFELIKNALNIKTKTEIATGAYKILLPYYCGGVLVHEALGHFFEIRPNAVVLDYLGKKIARSNMFVVDNPKLSNGFASFQYDDFGKKSDAVYLMKNGRVNRGFIDSELAEKFNIPATNQSRSSTKGIRPSARPSNTYLFAPVSIQHNKLSPDLTIHQMGGGKYVHSTGVCLFHIKLATIHIKNKIHVLEPFDLSIDAVNLIQKIRVVGQKLKLTPSLCLGESGVLPVSYGHPDLLIEQLEVQLCS